MNLPVKSAPSAIGHRADWLPDEGVWLYVRDILSEDFNVDVDALPDHWIPLAIVGTLDWIVICGWWIFRYTGLFESDEPYKFVFEFGGYEFSPDKLQVFRDSPERNQLERRVREPGLERKEREEALQFLFQDIFEVWWRQERGGSRSDAQDFFPPQEFMEITMYSVFLWVLDTYGRGWIYMQDDIFACAYDFGVAYLSKWDNTLLAPDEMICTNRPLHTCRYCGEKLWCVAGSNLGADWLSVCNHCLVGKALEGVVVEDHEERLRHPHCPHLRGVDDDPGSCVSTCPHSGMTQEKVWDRMEEWGSDRVEKYRERVEELGGVSPRQVAGQRLGDIVEHFTGAKAESGRFQTKRARKKLEER